MSVAELLKIVRGLSTGDRKALATIATRMKQRHTAVRRRKLTVAMLKPVPTVKFCSFTEIARHLAERFPEGGDFPSPPPRPGKK